MTTLDTPHFELQSNNIDSEIFYFFELLISNGCKRRLIDKLTKNKPRVKSIDQTFSYNKLI